MKTDNQNFSGLFHTPANSSIETSSLATLSSRQRQNADIATLMIHGERILSLRLDRVLEGDEIIFYGCIYHKPLLTDIENKGYKQKTLE